MTRQSRAVDAALESLTARNGSAPYADVPRVHGATVRIDGPVNLDKLVAAILHTTDQEN